MFQTLVKTEKERKKSEKEGLITILDLNIIKNQRNNTFQTHTHKH